MMTTATNIQENAEGILAEAKEINEKRKQTEVFEDESKEETENCKEVTAAPSDAVVE